MKYELYAKHYKPFTMYTLYDFNFIKWLKYGTAARRGLYLAYRLVYKKNTSIKFLYDLTQTISFFSLSIVDNLSFFRRSEGRFYLNHTKLKSSYLFKTFSDKLFTKNQSKFIFNNNNLTDKLHFNLINNFNIKFYIIMLNFFFFHFVNKNNFIFINLSFFAKFFSFYYKCTRDLVKISSYSNFVRASLIYSVNLFLFRFETTFVMNYIMRYEFLDLLEKNPLFNLFFKENKFESRNYVRHFVRFKYRRRFFRIFFILALKKVRWKLNKINNRYYKNIDLLTLVYKKYKLNLLFKKLFAFRFKKKGKRVRSLKFFLAAIKRISILKFNKKSKKFFFFRQRKFVRMLCLRRYLFFKKMKHFLKKRSKVLKGFQNFSFNFSKRYLDIKFYGSCIKSLPLFLYHKCCYFFIFLMYKYFYGSDNVSSVLLGLSLFLVDFYRHKIKLFGLFDFYLKSFHEFKSGTFNYDLVNFFHNDDKLSGFYGLESLLGRLITRKVINVLKKKKLKKFFFFYFKKIINKKFFKNSLDVIFKKIFPYFFFTVCFDKAFKPFLYCLNRSLKIALVVYNKNFYDDKIYIKNSSGYLPSCTELDFYKCFSAKSVKLKKSGKKSKKTNIKALKKTVFSCKKGFNCYFRQGLNVIKLANRLEIFKKSFKKKKKQFFILLNKKTKRRYVKWFKSLRRRMRYCLPRRRYRRRRKNYRMLRSQHKKYKYLRRRSFIMRKIKRTIYNSYVLSLFVYKKYNKLGTAGQRRLVYRCLKFEKGFNRKLKKNFYYKSRLVRYFTYKHIQKPVFSRNYVLLHLKGKKKKIFKRFKYIKNKKVLEYKDILFNWNKDFNFKLRFRYLFKLKFLQYGVFKNYKKCNKVLIKKCFSDKFYRKFKYLFFKSNNLIFNRLNGRFYGLRPCNTFKFNLYNFLYKKKKKQFKKFFIGRRFKGVSTPFIVMKKKNIYINFFFSRLLNFMLSIFFKTYKLPFNILRNFFFLHKFLYLKRLLLLLNNNIYKYAVKKNVSVFVGHKQFFMRFIIF